jgi:hypothetical protein
MSIFSITKKGEGNSKAGEGRQRKEGTMKMMADEGKELQRVNN